MDSELPLDEENVVTPPELPEEKSGEKTQIIPIEEMTDAIAEAHPINMDTLFTELHQYLTRGKKDEWPSGPEEKGILVLYPTEDTLEEVVLLLKRAGLRPDAGGGPEERSDRQSTYVSSFPNDSKFRAFPSPEIRDGKRVWMIRADMAGIRK
ncbi:MAG: hypothetical protein PHS53_00430 [Candidatus Pacebacteria bacterium]|nr:hypothetical protein [Candidatus Paceibacterota bacterium]MDD5356603.1 hypothetical protein [Candidatus Paceibacterota bacterium]